MWKLDCVYWDYDDKLVMPIYSDMPTIRNHKGNKKTVWENFYMHVSPLFIILDFPFLDEGRTAKL